MNKKVIYVSPMHLSDKVSQDWYVDYLIDKGVVVEFWDITLILREDFTEFSMKETDYLRMLGSYNELEARLSLSGNRNALYVIMFNFEGRFASIFRYLNKHECHTILIAWGASPILDVKICRKILSGFSNPLKLLINVFYRIKAIVYKKLKIVKPFDVVFTAGNVLMASYFFSKKKIAINQPDYDHYKKVKSEDERFLVCRYVVFLDQYLPYHSDFEYFGIPALDPVSYYASLNRFFDLIELKYGVKVVIASHPRADYSADKFNGRYACSGKTPEMVKDAEFVIAHYSTSVSYAVLNQKPLVFIYTNEMAELYRQTIMNHLYDLSDYLDASICNIDNLFKIEDDWLRSINSSAYKKYKNDFLSTPSSENTTTCEIFWREITKNILQHELAENK